MAGMSEYFEKKGASTVTPHNGITSESEWTHQYYSDLSRNLRAGGYMSPTDGSVKQHYYGNNIESANQNINNMILNHKGPKAFDTEDQNYMNSRFEFIAAEEQYRNSVYMLHGVPHIGYGLNLHANADIAKEVLKLDAKGFSKLMSGETTITERQGRLLFEAAVKDAERVVSTKLEGVPLNATQRIALVSMAYNAPALIGPNLTKHLKAGSAADVSYEILNKSNGNKLPALDNRRKREHDMFFGYDQEWTKVAKGDDLRSSGFQLANLFGISTAKADELNPMGRRELFDAPISNRPNKLLTMLAVQGHDAEITATELPPLDPNNTSDSPTRTNVPVDRIVPGTDQTLDQILGDDEPKYDRSTSPKPELRPDDMNYAGATPMPRPKLRPDDLNVRVSTRGEEPENKDPIRWGDINDISRVVYPTLFQKLTRPQISTPARAYGFYKMQKSTFNFETETYGNDFFNENEMDTLKNFVMWLESQGKTSAQYEDYDTFFGIREVNGMYLSEVVGAASGLKRIQSEYEKRGIYRPNDQELHEAAYGTDSLLGATADKYISMAKLAQDSFDPVLALGLTIGRFTWSRDESGRIIIEDTYDFTGMKKRQSAYSKVRGGEDDRGEKPAFKFRLVL